MAGADNIPDRGGRELCGAPGHLPIQALVKGAATMPAIDHRHLGHHRGDARIDGRDGEDVTAAQRCSPERDPVGIYPVTVPREPHRGAVVVLLLCHVDDLTGLPPLFPKCR